MYEDNPLLAPKVTDAARSWERSGDESMRAYAAFKIYLHGSRRLAEVAEKLVPACSVPNVARWSSKYLWQQRAWQWDKEEDRKQQEQEARDRAAARTRHLQIAREMQSIAPGRTIRGPYRSSKNFERCCGGDSELTAYPIPDCSTQISV
jgi:hypothetical protein